MSSGTKQPSDTYPSSPKGVFLAFFYQLRAQGLKVTPTQWLTLVEGLSLGLHGSSLIGFYSLARSILVKDESELDNFDLVFAQHFQDVSPDLPALEREIFDWLATPIAPYAVDPTLPTQLENVDVEALRRAFEERLKEQKERHDGGGRWIGTGGTSPFGHSGYHPGGIRVGGQGRQGSAVQVAAARQFKEHRRDLALDTRQFGVALKKLRALSRRGQRLELDIDQTIDQTAQKGDELSLVFRPPRKNNIALILAMDVGGSMEPYRHLVDLLFSAAHGARHFKRFSHVYFHNCIYERVYTDAGLSIPLPLDDLFRQFDRDCRLILVGDAHMYPGELTQRWGALDWTEQNENTGLFYLKQLQDFFHHAAWLNPMNPGMWAAPSIAMIRRIFEMHPLTIDGVDTLAQNLARG